MSNNVSARTIINVRAARTAKSFQASMRASGQLTQSVDKDGVPMPNWKDGGAGELATRPKLTAYAITNKPITGAQFKWVRVDPENISEPVVIRDYVAYGAGATPVDTEVDVTGLDGLKYKTFYNSAEKSETLTVCDNLGSKTNVRPDLIRCYMKYAINGVAEDEQQAQQVINIVRRSNDGYYMSIESSNGLHLNNDTKWIKLTAHVYNNAAEVPAGTLKFEWHKTAHFNDVEANSGAGTDILGQDGNRGLGKNEIYVARDESVQISDPANPGGVANYPVVYVDWQQLLVCCAYDGTAEWKPELGHFEDEKRIAQDNRTITDEADDYFIEYESRAGDENPKPNGTPIEVLAYVTHFDGGGWVKVEPLAGSKMQLTLLGLAGDRSEITELGTTSYTIGTGGVHLSPWASEYDTANFVFILRAPASLLTQYEHQAELAFEGTVVDQ